MHDPVIDDIKQRINIVEVIQEYFPLKKAGTNWKGLCPFHGEKTPSFMASEDRMIFHCFGCGEGGDVITFLQKMEGYDFPEALKILADRAGVQIQKRDPKIAHERNLLAEITDLSSRFYQKVLSDSPSAEPAREYLRSRGLKPETIRAFGIGFAPEGWETLYNFLSKKGYKDDDIMRSGMCLRSMNGRGLYDRFRKRIMFTIRDAQGRVVGFTGRLLPEDEKKPDAGGKYVNTPETPLYHKSSVLFALDAAKQEIRRQNLAVLVEGNMDVISSHQAGVANVIAASGTALTDEQLKLIGRYTQNLAVAFDSDAAGDTAARRGIVAALRNGFLVKVIVISPEQGKDPDDLVRKDPQLWKEAIAKAVDIIDYLVLRAKEKLNLRSAEGKKKAIEEINPIIAEAGDPVVQAHYVKVLAEAVATPEDVIRSQIPSRKTSASALPVADARQPVSQPIARERLLSERLMAIYLTHETARKTVQDLLKTEYLAGDDLKGLYATELSAYNQINTSNPVSRDERLSGLYSILPLLLDNTPAENPADEAKNIIYDLAAIFRNEERKRLESEMRDAEAVGDFGRISELMKKFKEI